MYFTLLLLIIVILLFCINESRIENYSQSDRNLDEEIKLDKLRLLWLRNNDFDDLDAHPEDIQHVILGF